MKRNGKGGGGASSWPMAKILAKRVLLRIFENKSYYAKRLGARLARASLGPVAILAMAMALAFVGAGLVVAGRGGHTLMTLGIHVLGEDGEGAMALAVDKCEIQKGSEVIIGIVPLACIQRDGGLHLIKRYDVAYMDCSDSGCLLSVREMVSAKYVAKKGARWIKESKGNPNWGALFALITGQRGADAEMSGYDLAWASYHGNSSSEPRRWAFAAFELGAGAIFWMVGMGALALLVVVLAWVLIWIPTSVMCMFARDVSVGLWSKAVGAGLKMGGLSSLEHLRQAAEAESCANALDGVAEKADSSRRENRGGRL